MPTMPHTFRTFTAAFLHGARETPAGFFVPLGALWRLSRRVLQTITR